MQQADIVFEIAKDRGALILEPEWKDSQEVAVEAAIVLMHIFGESHGRPKCPMWLYREFGSGEIVSVADILDIDHGRAFRVWELLPEELVDAQ